MATGDENQLIQNYGLYWRRDRVEWGQQGRVRGALWGKERGGKKKLPVDFRAQKGIYALYDDSFNLVYVGQAGKGKGKGRKDKGQSGAQTLFARIEGPVRNSVCRRI